MLRRTSSVRWMMCVTTLLVSGFPLAHAKDKDIYAKTRVFVPDTGNNRVLVYNLPESNGQGADAVLGQSDENSKGSGTTATNMFAPTAFVVDDAGELIVSDSNNCRLLVFKPPFTTGQAASAVIGKPDFLTSCGTLTPSQTNLGATGGVAVDNSGNLWVADSQNNRVLHFKAPFKTGKAADIVIGQPDYVSNTCPATPTAASLCFPLGVGSDSDNILWVADMANSRVLGYKSPKKSMNASFVLGHSGATAFTSNTANDGGISARSFAMPTGIGFDSKDFMWVADTGNSRVLMFKPDFKTGIAAKLVLGQNDFVSAFANQNGLPGAATLSSPQGIFTQKETTVWVGDTGNNRTLQFVSPYANGMSASLVLGQPDFTSNQPNQSNAVPDEKTQSAPFNEIAAQNAGSSLLALAVLASLGGLWLVMRRFRRRTV